VQTAFHDAAVSDSASTIYNVFQWVVYFKCISKVMNVMNILYCNKVNCIEPSNTDNGKSKIKK
jgi:hypothetical protein